MIVFLEIGAGVLIGALLIFTVSRIYRYFRPLPELNITLLRTKEDYFAGTTYTFQCGVCDTTSAIASKALYPSLTCAICGEGGSLSRVQADMRKRIKAKKAAAESQVKAAEQQAREVKEGGRRIDLEKK